MYVYFVFVLDNRCRGDEIVWARMTPHFSLEEADDCAHYEVSREIEYYGFDQNFLITYPLKPDALRYAIHNTSFAVVIRRVHIDFD